jgi:hypothetical protein
LIAVPGTVTIEAWNSDFNCSKLVEQMQASIIQNLVCNGTNNGTRGAHHSKLSKGAEAGIGVGVAVLVIGIAVLAWLGFHSRRRSSRTAESR